MSLSRIDLSPLKAKLLHRNSYYGDFHRAFWQQDFRSALGIFRNPYFDYVGRGFRSSAIFYSSCLRRVIKPLSVAFQVEQDAGNTRASIYRVYNTGSISAKLAVAFAQRLNSDPYYLTGEKDEDSGYNEERVDRFLREKGYAKLLDEMTAAAPSKKRTQRRKADSEPKSEETPDIMPFEKKANDYTSPVYIEENVVSGKENADTVPLNTEDESEIITSSDTDSENVLADITEEDMKVILHSLVIRARVSSDARERLEKIKYLLVY